MKVRLYLLFVHTRGHLCRIHAILYTVLQVLGLIMLFNQNPIVLMAAESSEEPATNLCKEIKTNRLCRESTDRCEFRGGNRWDGQDGRLTPSDRWCINNTKLNKTPQRKQLAVHTMRPYVVCFLALLDLFLKFYPSQQLSLLQVYVSLILFITLCKHVGQPTLTIQFHAHAWNLSFLLKEAWCRIFFSDLPYCKCQCGLN